LTSGGLSVALHLGYRFGQVETWTAVNYSGAVRLERTAVVSFSTGTGGSGDASNGYTTADYSYGGGLASTQNEAGTERDLIDINSDGLPDLVIKPVGTTDISSGSTTITVYLNTGAGFLPGQTWNGALPVPIQSRHGVHRNLLRFAEPAAGLRRRRLCRPH
jgi:hypothetical protein